MKKIVGTLNGTGAALYVCLGFIPDYVRVISVEDAEAAELIWYRNFRAAEMVAGLMKHNGEAPVLKTAGQAIEVYEGGDVLDSSLQTSVAYGEGVYLAYDQRDYRAADQDADLVDINAWSLQHAGNRTGKFNADVASDAVHIGEGSQICIDGKWATILALTAGEGAGDNEVTLDRPLGSGEVQAIRGRFDFAPLAVGEVTPAGFKLSLTTDINVNDETQLIIAEQFAY